MHVTSVESTELFTGPADAPLQLVLVSYRDCSTPTHVRVEGPGLEPVSEVLAEPGGASVEVAVRVTDPVPGQRRRARGVAGESAVDFDFTVAEPGWTMFMVCHFHYDPVWWNTQAAYTSVWTEEPPGRCRQTIFFEWDGDH